MNLALSPATPSSATEASSQHKTITSSAKDFESILLGQWLGAAERSFGTVPGADDDEDSSNDQLKSLGVQQVARAITDAGGIGIAPLVSKALARTQASAHSEDHAHAAVSR